MTITFRIAACAAFVILSVFPALGQALPSSMQGLHSQMRLLSGGKQGENWLAGVEITLDQGFKTYWRNPGESGLPPSFDWSASDNVAGVDVQWPAPERHEDAAGVSYVYSHKVVLPLLVRPTAADKPVKLALTIDYGVCKDICIPAHAELNLMLSEAAPDRAAIEQAMAKVPRPQAAGNQGELAVLSVTSASAGKAALIVTVRAPAGIEPTLFAEAPENWYVSTSSPNPASQLLSGTRFFTVAIEEKPKEASPPIPLRLTLVAGDKAVETEVSLDANGLPR